MNKCLSMILTTVLTISLTALSGCGGGSDKGTTDNSDERAESLSSSNTSTPSPSYSYTSPSDIPLPPDYPEFHGVYVVEDGVWVDFDKSDLSRASGNTSGNQVFLLYDPGVRTGSTTLSLYETRFETIEAFSGLIEKAIQEHMPQDSDFSHAEMQRSIDALGEEWEQSAFEERTGRSRYATEVSLRTKPVPDQQEMLLYVPEQTLEQGYYQLGGGARLFVGWDGYAERQITEIKRLMNEGKYHDAFDQMVLCGMIEQLSENSDLDALNESTNGDQLAREIILQVGRGYIRDKKFREANAFIAMIGERVVGVENASAEQRQLLSDLNADLMAAFEEENIRLNEEMARREELKAHNRENFHTWDNGLFLDSAPDDIRTVPELMKTVSEGDDVVVRVVVGGSDQPIMEGIAYFSTIDGTVVNVCLDADESCTTPWDYCCVLGETRTANRAMITIVDEDGRMMRMDISGKIKPLSTLVIRGVAGPRPDMMMTITATGIYIESGPDGEEATTRDSSSTGVEDSAEELRRRAEELAEESADSAEETRRAAEELRREAEDTDSGSASDASSEAIAESLRDREMDRLSGRTGDQCKFRAPGREMARSHYIQSMRDRGMNEQAAERSWQRQAERVEARWREDFGERSGQSADRLTMLWETGIVPPVEGIDMPDATWPADESGRDLTRRITVGLLVRYGFSEAYSTGHWEHFAETIREEFIRIVMEQTEVSEERAAELWEEPRE